MREEFLATGEEKMVAANASFKNMAGQMGEFEQSRLENSNDEGFDSYGRAIEKRLAAHHFDCPQAFQLLPDSRQQDKYTTWVEYLNSVY